VRTTEGQMLQAAAPPAAAILVVESTAAAVSVTRWARLRMSSCLGRGRVSHRPLTEVGATGCRRPGGCCVGLQAKL
jgi:hypothetical protein